MVNDNDDDVDNDEEVELVESFGGIKTTGLARDDDDDDDNNDDGYE